MAEIVSLESERAKCLARLQTQTSGRHRTYFELASIAARLRRGDEAISMLREAVASGLDPVYAEELRTSEHFGALDDLPAFESILAALEGRLEVNADNKQNFLYAIGEKERCLTEALVCGICNEPLQEPQVHDPCGSLFCSTCLSASCPQCQGDMNSETLSKMKARVILSKLDNLKVHCPRCFKILERSTVDGHIQSCPVYCPSGCKQKVSPSQLEEHALACVAVEVTCSAADVQCPWIGTRKDLFGHTRGCTFLKQQAVLRRVIALEEASSAHQQRVAVLEEANRALTEANLELRTRMARMEGVENI